MKTEAVLNDLIDAVDQLTDAVEDMCPGTQEKIRFTRMLLARAAEAMNDIPTPELSE